MKYLKIILIILLLVCLLPMPFGFYNLVRFAAMTGCIIIAYDYFKQRKQPLVILFSCLALLFQPFLKVALGRTIWNVVDFIIAVLLTVLIFKIPNK